MIILGASFFAIFKLIQQNSLSAHSSSIKPTLTQPQTQIISWETTSQLMSDCQIKSIFQNRDLTATLRSHDNQIYQTTQPKLDDIFKLAKKHQGPCDIIQMISE